MSFDKIIEAPVVLFVYKRPDHTKKIIEKIKQIKLKKLYVIGDGWKSKDDKILVKETRELINNLPFKTEKFFFENNVGLRKNAELGLNYVFNSEEKAIILEDDTLPSISFFQFCDNLLKRYENNKEVSMISGSNFKTQLTLDLKEDYFFSKYPCFWGWATWKDRWNILFDNKMQKWTEFKENKFYKYFNNKRELKYWEERFNFHQKNLKLGTWDYPFFLNHFFYKKNAIISKKNLIKNIGYDIPTSQNPKKTSMLDLYELNFPLQHPINFNLNGEYNDFCSKKLFSKSKLLWRIKQKLRKILTFFKLIK